MTSVAKLPGFWVGDNKSVSDSGTKWMNSDEFNI